MMLLDTKDPLVPIETEDASPAFLPLYYPLRFGMGGGEAQYEILADDIKLYAICDTEPDDDEYPFMTAFPKLLFDLVPFTYEQYRAHLVSEQGTGMETSPEDWKIVKEQVDPWHLIQFGGAIYPVQGDISWKCQNKKCEWHDVDARIDTFCRVSATPKDEIQIFGELGTYFEIYFGLCRVCGTIVTVNRCT